jgi:hypothetical protein
MSDRKKPGTGILVVSVEDRDLFKFVAALVLCLILALGAFAYSQWRTNNRIDKSQADIVENTIRIEAQDRADTVRLRRTDARICARDNLERAEIHVAYSQETPLPPPESFGQQSSILAVLLEGARKVQINGLKRVRRTLPILECAPHLEGKPAFPLSPKLQKRFVKLYSSGKLHATPTPEDAAKGPDEVP